uniref:Secreted protein n=1 Tax=Cucumis melo TaxID=3656 RepID=A0A9I9E654_CUCME
MRITLPLLFLLSSQVKNLFSIFVESCLEFIIVDQERKYRKLWGAGGGEDNDDRNLISLSLSLLNNKTKLY